MTDICKVTRRHTLALGAGALASTIARSAPAQEQEGPERHGISAFGDLKYPAAFKHFDYVAPDAPKGGTFSQVGSNRVFNQNFLTFNSLNIFILKGDGAQGMELTFASLMARAADVPDSLYGLAARAVRRGWADLPFSDAARHQLPRRQPDHRARRRLLAQDPQGEGPPDRPAIAARLRRRGG